MHNIIHVYLFTRITEINFVALTNTRIILQIRKLKINLKNFQKFESFGTKKNSEICLKF